MFIKFVDTDRLFCQNLTIVCSLRACHMLLTMNLMFIREILEKFTSFIF